MSSIRTMSSKKLAALAGTVADLAGVVEPLAAQVAELSKQSAPAEIMGLKAAVAGLAASFSKMAPVIRAAIEERERERQDLVAKLAGCDVPFSALELECKPIAELRLLRQLVDALGEPWYSRSRYKIFDPDAAPHLIAVGEFAEFQRWKATQRKAARTKAKPKRKGAA